MNFTSKIANFVVKGRWYFLGVFVALAIASLIVFPMVGTNYDMTKYLPADSNTKIALEVMDEEFGSSGTASLVITNATVAQVQEVATRAEQIDGVKNALFFENASYYNVETRAGLIQIFFDHGNYDLETEQALNDLRDLCDELNASAAFCGDSVDAAASKNAITSEVGIILIVAIIIMLGILFFTSRSWIEPLVYLIVIGVSILINMGTNIILGEISYITQSISAIMLMAIIMDYCIVLCSRYREESVKGGTPAEVMTRALAGSFNAILACSLTVLVGLVALCFMDFSIGLDLGLVLAKGVLISIFAVLFLMPSVILMFQKPMHAWEHKSFLPKLNKLGTFAYKTRWVMPIIMLCLIVGGVVLQQNVTYSYVVDNHLAGSQLAQDAQTVEDNFGKQNTLVVMVPRGKMDSELQILTDALNLTIDDEGTLTINSASGFCSTALAMSLNAEQIAQQFKLDATAVASVYVQLQKEPTASLYAYEVLDVLQANPSIIRGSFERKQAEFDTQYATLAGIQISASPASEFNIYTQGSYLFMHSKMSTSTEDLAIFAGIYANILNKQVANLTDEDVLPAYAVIKGLESAGVLASYPTLSAVMTNAGTQIYATYTAQQATAMGLQADTVSQIWATYGVAEGGTLYACQLIEAMHTPVRADETILDMYSDAVVAEVGASYQSKEAAEAMYYSENYARLIFNINAGVDDQKAIDTIIKLREKLDADYVGAGIYSEYFIVNSTQNVIDTMEVFETDRTRTDLITIIGVLVLILLLMRSVSIPVLLVLLIQGAIWINLAIGTFFGETIFFVCYLLAMVIQMGATIDYAILMTDRYVFFRKSQGKQEAIKSALNSAFPTVITSGAILIVAAYSIHFISTLPLLKSIGGLIGRGALISVLAVMFVLPSILVLFDKVVCKTTLKAKFIDDKQNLMLATAAASIEGAGDVAGASADAGVGTSASDGDAPADSANVSKGEDVAKDADTDKAKAIAVADRGAELDDASAGTNIAIEEASDTAASGSSRV